MGKHKLCGCPPPVSSTSRFKVGDRVVCKSGYRDPDGFVRTVVRVDSLIPYTTELGYRVTCLVTTDNGPLCSGCGLPRVSPRVRMIDHWFRMATRREIVFCSKVYGKSSIFKG